MLYHRSNIIAIALCFILMIVTGCGMFSPAPKPDVGPAGKPVESKPNPPIAERFQSAPAEMYDLEAFAGEIFEGINKQNWQQANNNFIPMQNTWAQVKAIVGDKKGVKDADEAIQKLAKSLAANQIVESYENLNKFMSSVNDIGKSYKLSPLPSIISVGNSIRSVSFFVQAKNWEKANAKMKELEATWQHAKPAIEQPGVLGESTKIHARINQLKGAVTGESQGSAEEQIASLNESMSILRQYYRGQ